MLQRLRIEKLDYEESNQFFLMKKQINIIDDTEQTISRISEPLNLVLFYPLD